MVEFSPATREARVRFPASSEFLYDSFILQIDFVSQINKNFILTLFALYDINFFPTTLNIFSKEIISVKTKCRNYGNSYRTLVSSGPVK